ncbi:MAG TPA: hypothetical protein VFH31_18730 [Pyrinomonadaceae bacterium]|nr:hypothetical protein [Pyrinomonadaceae bacterium]
MTRRRRLEITVSRRRTTVILRAGTEGDAVRLSAREKEATSSIPWEAENGRVIDIDPIQIANAHVVAAPGRVPVTFRALLQRLMHSLNWRK